MSFKIKNAITKYCEEKSCKHFWGVEEGFAWLTLYGHKLNVKAHEKISQEIANLCGHDFYLSSARCDVIEGAFDFDFSTQKRYSENEKTNIDSYGKRFAVQ
ncbi:hypothetical protein GW796_09575 [archaeon]|nr:hypothetical protein [archaeon]